MGPLEISLHTGLSLTEGEGSQTSLWAVILINSSSDAILITGLGCKKSINYQKKKKRWMNVSWMTTQLSGITQSHLLTNQNEKMNETILGLY